MRGLVAVCLTLLGGVSPALSDDQLLIRLIDPPDANGKRAIAFTEFEITSRMAEPFTVLFAVGNHRDDCTLFPTVSLDDKVLLLALSEKSIQNFGVVPTQPGDRFHIDFKGTPCASADVDLFTWEVTMVFADERRQVLTWKLD